MREFDFKSFKFLAMILAVCTFISIPTFLSFSSYLETMFYPVVTEFRINSEIPTAAGHTILAGEYHKRRACVSRGVTWYIKDKKTSQDIPLPVNKLIVTQNRPIGEHMFGPWEIWAEQKDLRENGFAVVLHDCHPFYLTRSIVYAKGQFR